MERPQSSEEHVDIENDSEMCTICQAPLELDIIWQAPNCADRFHKNCIDKWMAEPRSQASKCPNCRHELRATDRVRVVNPPSPTQYVGEFFDAMIIRSASSSPTADPVSDDEEPLIRRRNADRNPFSARMNTFANLEPTADSFADQPLPRSRSNSTFSNASASTRQSSTSASSRQSSASASSRSSHGSSSSRSSVIDPLREVPGVTREPFVDDEGLYPRCQAILQRNPVQCPLEAYKEYNLCKRHLKQKFTQRSRQQKKEVEQEARLLNALADETSLIIQVTTGELTRQRRAQQNLARADDIISSSEETIALLNQNIQSLFGNHGIQRTPPTTPPRRDY